jgi:hypothetical protein
MISLLMALLVRLYERLRGKRSKPTPEDIEKEWDDNDSGI